MRKGSKLSEETRHKMSEAQKRRYTLNSKAPLSAEAKKKISDALRGRSLSEEHKKKLSESGKGKMAGEKHWNYGKKTPDSVKIKLSESLKGEKNPMYGNHHSEETKRKMRESALKRPPFSIEHRKHMSESRKGRIFSDEHRRHMMESATGRILSEETKLKIGKASKGRKHSEESKLKMSHKGENNPMYGIYHSDETKRKQSLIKMGEKNPMYTRKGETNPAWNGGGSFEPYDAAFNDSLKRKIRERDHYTCQYCGVPGKHVHHIDHNKKNSVPSNLITLCLAHNTKSEYIPRVWECLFRTILAYRGYQI